MKGTIFYLISLLLGILNWIILYIRIFVYVERDIESILYKYEMFSIIPAILSIYIAKYLYENNLILLKKRKVNYYINIPYIIISGLFTLLFLFLVFNPPV